ncbi:MAG: hypothetical protein R3Y12_04535 [Clostridia bacterium]
MNFFPTIELEKGLRTFAKLEIIALSKEDSWLRFCTFEKVTSNTRKYTIDTGDGENMIILTDGTSALIRGFDQSSGVSPYANGNSENLMRQIYKNAPAKYFDLLSYDEKMETSFALWNTSGTSNWDINLIDPDDDGGLLYLIKFLFSSPEQLIKWAREYHEKIFARPLIIKIWENATINGEMVLKLNKNRDLHEALTELNEFNK